MWTNTSLDNAIRCNMVNHLIACTHSNPHIHWYNTLAQFPALTTTSTAPHCCWQSHYSQWGECLTSLMHCPHCGPVDCQQQWLPVSEWSNFLTLDGPYVDRRASRLTIQIYRRASSLTTENGLSSDTTEGPQAWPTEKGLKPGHGKGSCTWSKSLSPDHTEGPRAWPQRRTSHSFMWNGLVPV